MTQDTSVGVLVNSKYQSQGYEREAIASVLGFGFDALRVHRITASCDGRAEACCRVFEHVGMRREGEFVQDHFAKSEWASTLWYAILASEYAKTSHKG